MRLISLLHHNTTIEGVSANVSAWRQLFVTCNVPMSIMMSEPASPRSGPSAPRNGPANVIPGLINDPLSKITDDSLAGSFYTLPQRHPVTIENTTWYPESTFLVSLATPSLEYETTTIHLLCHRPVPGDDDEVVETVLAREMYRMGCWASVKFGLDGLPGHLAAVRAVQDSLAVDDD